MTINWLMAAFILILTFMVMVGLYALMLLDEEDAEEFPVAPVEERIGRYTQRSIADEAAEWLAVREASR